MKKIKLNQLIEIEWIDSHHPVHNERWIEPERVVEWLKESSPATCKSAGYFLAYTKNEVTIYQSHDGENCVLNLMAIPKGCVKKIRVLK